MIYVMPEDFWAKTLSVFVPVTVFVIKHKPSKIGTVTAGNTPTTKCNEQLLAFAHIPQTVRPVSATIRGLTF
jgi:hypothetical protein